MTIGGMWVTHPCSRATSAKLLSTGLQDWENTMNFDLKGTPSSTTPGDLPSVPKIACAKWDVIEIDAFAGDSIPTQLVSDEAFDLYRKRLAPGGILGLHVSNW